MLWLLIAACGQYIDAGDTALGQCEDIEATVELATRDELTSATTMGHYGLTGLLNTHTYTESWSGGELRSVAYGDLIASPEAGITLADTLTNMSSVDPSALASHEERFAFWLNLYNAWVLYGAQAQIQADPGWIGAESASWDGQDTGTDFAMFLVRFVSVGGELLTLNDVEHTVMRGWVPDEIAAEDQARYDKMAIWHSELWGGDVPDARLHMGINCASRSCPDIGKTAFVAATVYDQLDALAVGFLAHPGKGAGPDGISTLFNWFRADFEGSHGSVESFVQTYRSGGDADVDYGTYLPYIWDLNGG